MKEFNEIIDYLRVELFKNKKSILQLERELGLYRGSIAQKIRNKSVKLTDIITYLDSVNKKIVISDK